MRRQDVGFLKGSYADKIKPFMASYLDVLDKLGEADMAMFMDEDEKDSKSSSPIKFESLTFIRGRNLNDIIIVDEAQNLTQHELKTLITRADEGAKVILIGDTDQIDVSYVNKHTNGLSYVIDALKHLPFTGHIKLLKSERSRLAAAAGQLL
jgi:PhoH-like ATPase